MGTRPWPADRPSPLLPDRPHGFMDLVFPAFRLQPPGAPGHRFGRSPRFTVTGFPAISAGETARHWGFAFGVQARRRHPAESSSLPTDRWFTSSCSPPHLAVGQLLSITGLRTWAWWGLAPHGPDTLTIAHPCRLARQVKQFVRLVERADSAHYRARRLCSKRKPRKDKRPFGTDACYLCFLCS